METENGNEERRMEEEAQVQKGELHIEIGLASEANESTPLLSKQRGAQRPTLQSSSSTTPSLRSAASSAIYTKDCLNWRILLFLSMIITSLGLATYLLWRQTHFSDLGYSFEIIEHDLWSNMVLRSPFLSAQNVRNVFITHTASDECYEKCVELLHRLQNLCLDELPYNFLITSECQVFEARGWHYESNFGEEIPEAISLVIALVGNFTSNSANRQLQTAEALIRESIKRHRLQMDYKLFALRNTTRHAHDAAIMKEQMELWSNYRGEWIIK